MAYDNNNRLALWINNERKEATHPHLTGQGQVTDEFYVNAWFSKDIDETDRRVLGDILKRYNSKKPFISLSLKPKQQRVRPEASSAATAPEPIADFDDDIPFIPRTW